MRSDLWGYNVSLEIAYGVIPPNLIQLIEQDSEMQHPLYAFDN